VAFAHYSAAEHCQNGPDSYWIHQVRRMTFVSNVFQREMSATEASAPVLATSIDGKDAAVTMQQK